MNDRVMKERDVMQSKKRSLTFKDVMGNPLKKFHQCTFKQNKLPPVCSLILVHFIFVIVIIFQL